MNNKKIPIVFGFDENYKLPATIAIKSMIENKYPETEYDIFVLHPGLKQSTKEQIETITKVNWIEVKQDMLPKVPTGWSGLATWYRLLIPTLIPQYDKIIWADVDFLIKPDLREVFNTDMENYDWAGVAIEKRGTKNGIHNWFEENKNDFIYIPGLMVFNAKRWRENKLFDKCVEIINKYQKKLTMFDLDVLNLLTDKIKPLSFKYSVFETLYDYTDITRTKDYKWLSESWTKEELEETRRNPAIIHYAGKNIKIWNRAFRQISNYYWREIEASPCYNSIYYFPTKLTKVCNNLLKVVRKITPFKKARNYLKKYITRRYSSYSFDIEAKLKKQIDKAEIVSFDIFDTLLVRPFINPTHVFKFIEVNEKIPGFYDARIYAESLARAATDKEDITLDDIYKFINPKYKTCKNIEMECEGNILIFNPFMINIYNYAKNKGKKIAIISDMYLPKKLLEATLKKNGIRDWNYFYLSSEHGKTKASGNLFKVFLDDVKVPVNKIVHIGDSKLSDYKNPRKFEITSICIPKNIDLFFTKYKKFRELYELHPDSLEISIILSILAEDYITNPELFIDKGYWYKNFGYMIAGPIVYSFSKYILDIAKNNSKQNLLCIARDGYILSVILKLLNKEKHNISYVYTNRVIASSVLGIYDNESIDLVLNLLRENSKLSIPENFKTYEEKDRFIQENKKELKKYFDKKKEEYKNYLNSIEANSENSLIVDSAASHFTAQKFLSTVTEKNIDGAYISVWDPSYANKNGLSYFSWSKNPVEISFITPIIEFVLGANEPPIIGLNSDFTPVYQKEIHKEELNRNKIAKILEPEIERFTLDIKNRFKSLNFVFDAGKINDFVMCYLTKLNKTDKKYFSKIYHSNNSIHTIYRHNLLKPIKEMPFKITSYLFGFLKLFEIVNVTNKKVLKLFGLLPIVSLVYKYNCKYITLLDIGCGIRIPFIKIKRKTNGKYYIYLFNIIKICKVTRLWF